MSEVARDDTRGCQRCNPRDDVARRAAAVADGGRGRCAAPHDPEGHLREGRARPDPRRAPLAAARPVRSRRAATLDRRKTSAVARRFRTMTIRVRPYRRGGYEVDIR